ncbi:MAG: mechanosensitive ion channel family protein [Candidatus Rokubacteria bacterium]|nr:mechanosensitive ion channel family protein [Candidatus Rokubacteria bacterium]
MYWPFVWPGLTFVAVTLAALLVREVAFRALGRWRSGPDGRTPALDVVRIPSLLWCLVAGIAAAIEIAPLPGRAASLLNLALIASIILSVTVTVANVVGIAIARAGDRRALGSPVTGLAQTSARGTVFIVGGLVLLGALGVQITPLLTALGVGGLAVALALQDTLSNLFAGLHLLADKPIRVGDYVKIGDTEGFVVDVGWRSTRVRLLQNSVVIVPNSNVAKSTIINYDLPESRMALTLRVRADYAVDPERIETLLAEEAARAVPEVPGLLADPPARAMLIPGFGETTLEYSLTCHVVRFVDQFPVQHELRKRILRRFRAEGLAMMAPARVVNVQDRTDDRPPPRA